MIQPKTQKFWTLQYIFGLANLQNHNMRYIRDFRCMEGFCQGFFWRFFWALFPQSWGEIQKIWRHETREISGDSKKCAKNPFSQKPTLTWSAPKEIFTPPPHGLSGADATPPPVALQSVATPPVAALSAVSRVSQGCRSYTPPKTPAAPHPGPPCRVSQVVWTSETCRAPGGVAAIRAGVALHFDTKSPKNPTLTLKTLTPLNKEARPLKFHFS